MRMNLLNFSATAPEKRHLLLLSLTVLLLPSFIAAQTLKPHADGGWVTTGLPYECRINADGKMKSLTVGNFDFVGKQDGMFLIDQKRHVPFAKTEVVNDELRIAAEGASLRIVFLPQGPKITVANHNLRHGSVFRLRLSPDVVRIRPLGRSTEPEMPLKGGVSGALRFISPNGASLTFGRSSSYHPGASCNAYASDGAIVVEMPWIMPELTTDFQLTVSPTRNLEDAVLLKADTDRPDNTFWDDKPVTLRVNAENMLPGEELEGAVILKVRHYLTRDLTHEERQAVAIAAGGEQKLTWTIASLDPMLYVAELWLEKDGKQGFCSAPRFVFDAGRILPPEVPEDFDAFWEQTLKEQTAIPLDLKLEKIREENDQELYKFSFAGLLKYRCYGWLTVPKDKSKKVPAVLILPPAGMRSQPIPWRKGEVGMAININGVDVGLRDEEYDWRTWPAPYLVTGILDKNHYSLRFGYAAIARAWEVLAARAEVAPEQIRVEGSSQGGGLTLIAAGLIPNAFTSATARKPGLCRLDWNLDYLNPPFFPIAATEDGKANIHQTLKYFLPSHFTRRIKCPIDVSLGLYDDVTPAVSVFCAYNAIPGDNKKLTVDANAGH